MFGEAKNKFIAGRKSPNNIFDNQLLLRSQPKLNKSDSICLTNSMQHTLKYIENMVDIDPYDRLSCSLDRKKHTMLTKANYYPFSQNNTKIKKQKRMNKSNKTLKGNSNMQASMIHSDDSISTRLFANWITSKYEFSIDKLIQIEEDTVDKILKDKCFTKNMKIEGGYTNYLVMNDEILIIVNKKPIEGNQERSEVYFELFAKDMDAYSKYYDYIMKLDKEVKIGSFTIEYHSFYNQQFGMVSSNVEYFTKDIFDEVTNLFYEPYLDTNLLFEQFLDSRSVMLQLTGKPGLGKSKLISLFIKYLIENPKQVNETNVLKIARPANSEVLAEEEFWVKLRQQGFHALILDDVDYILQKRNDTITSTEEKTHNEIIRKILTYTDGLTTQKSKILISTNLEYHKIDQALIRDFRLFDSIELRALHPKEALKIWKDGYSLDEDEFYRIFDDKEDITSAKLAKEIEALQNSHKNGETDTKKSYLKEDDISKISSLRGQKSRVGLV